MPKRHTPSPHKRDLYPSWIKIKQILTKINIQLQIHKHENLVIKILSGKTG